MLHLTAFEKYNSAKVQIITLDLTFYEEIFRNRLLYPPMHAPIYLSQIPGDLGPTEK